MNDVDEATRDMLERARLWREEQQRQFGVEPYEQKRITPTPAQQRKSKYDGKLDHNITDELLDARSARATNHGYPVPQWINFSRMLLAEGYTIRIHEARTTVSKYLKVSWPHCRGMVFTVRFSNHKPNRMKERAGLCDFWVGHHHGGVHTTGQAIDAVRAYFGHPQQ